MPKEKHVKNHNAVLIEDIEREHDKTLCIEFEAEIKELENCNVKADLELKSLGISKVIGSSLGGFIVLNLGNEFKKIVFNPCMKPSVELPKLGAPEKMVAKYTSIENTFFSNLKGDELDKATTCGFFGDSDELFGPYGYKLLFKSYYRNAYNIKCGHKIEDSAIKKIAYRIKIFFAYKNTSIIFP